MEESLREWPEIRTEAVFSLQGTSTPGACLEKCFCIAAGLRLQYQLTHRAFPLGSSPMLRWPRRGQGWIVFACLLLTLPAAAQPVVGPDKKYEAVVRDLDAFIAREVKTKALPALSIA